jgi:hypothetical protein
MVPQPPQLPGSEPVFTQLPEQSLRPPEQKSVQPPSMQLWPALQETMQLPQWRLSLESSAQNELPPKVQRLDPASTRQPSWQLPETQASPPAQATPQPPQLALSLWMSTQVPAQTLPPAQLGPESGAGGVPLSTSPASEGCWQVPATQTSPVLQGELLLQGAGVAENLRQPEANRARQASFRMVAFKD